MRGRPRRTVRGAARRVDQALRRTRLRMSGGAPGGGLILLYHRVAELASDPWGLAVSPAHFGEQLAVLRNRYRPLSLGALVAARAGGVASRSVVVTFDDGYADNVSRALPLWERHRVPVTCFVTTGAIGGDGEFWWDELDGIVLQPGTLPPLAQLGGPLRDLRPAEGCTTLSEADCQRHRQWRADSPTSPTPRHRLYRQMHQRLKELPAQEREAALGELRAWAGAQTSARASHRVLSVDEVRELAGRELVEVGAHSVSHPVLTAMARPAQEDEVLGSKSWLEDVTGQPVASFAYPYGSYSSGSIDIVRAAGFGCACTTRRGVVTESSEPFDLPRMVVGDWPGETFARRLDDWFIGLR